MLKWFKIEIYKDGKEIFGDLIQRDNRNEVKEYLTKLTNTPEYLDADEATFMELKPIKEVMRIGLSEHDVLDLLIILRNFIDLQKEEIEKVEADRKAGVQLALFDDYADFFAALYATKDNAKHLLKELQRQTGEKIINEEAIDKL